MYINDLSPVAGSTHVDKRKGRGHATGNGKTAGRGHKGQKARSGGGLTIRKDDAPETVMARLETYHKETEPLKAFYEARGKLKSVENQPSIEATTAAITKALGI